MVCSDRNSRFSGMKSVVRLIHINLWWIKGRINSLHCKNQNLSEGRGVFPPNTIILADNVYIS